MKTLRGLIVCLICVYCNNNKTKLNKIGNIYFETPKEWQKIEKKGIDSKILTFLVNQSDTIFVEFGKFNNPFDEENNVINSLAMYKLIKEANPETNSILAIDTIYDYQQAIFLKNYYYYDTIDNHLAKIMLPKINNEGSAGVYFKSVDINNNHFSIYTYDALSKGDIENLMKVFYSIKFK